MSETDDDDKENEALFPQDWKNAITYLKSTWEAMAPPVPEQDLQDDWYAAIYYNMRRKGTLYIGRLTKRSTDGNGALDKVELDCLKPATSPSSIDIEEPPAHLGKDYGVFKIYDVIAGPLPVTYVYGRKWRYPNYPSLYQFFKLVDKQKRDTIKFI